MEAGVSQKKLTSRLGIIFRTHEGLKGGDTGQDGTKPKERRAPHPKGPGGQYGNRSRKKNGGLQRTTHNMKRGKTISARKKKGEKRAVGETRGTIRTKKQEKHRKRAECKDAGWPVGSREEISEVTAKQGGLIEGGGRNPVNGASDTIRGKQKKKGER